MKLIVECLIIILLVFSITVAYELKFVGTFIRHGDRVPTKNIPDDGTIWECKLNSLEMYNNHNFPKPTPSRHFGKKFIYDRNILPGNCSRGQLTEIGAKQQQDLGSKFRNKYVDDLNFLPRELDPDLIWLRSTDTSRTMRSAANFFSGLYPPKDKKKQDVFPIHTMDWNNENMHFNTKLCPRLAILKNQIKRSAKYRAHMDSIDFFIYQIDKIYGFIDLDGHSLLTLYNNAVFRIRHNKTLPNGLTENLIKQLKKEGGWYANFVMGNKTLVKLTIGPFLQDLLDAFDSKITGENQHKFHLYSAHNSGIVPLLAAYDSFDSTPVEFASNVVFELYQEKKKYYIKLSYNDKVIKIPGCKQEMCPYSKFKKITQKMIPKNYEKECRI
ncbi:lysophosphatidic acid phosphatase type 6 [Anaeramoeba flamelloides]|uniref:Lysophosphatidic acid phosphatase type n=1 Tax=Anaeramoeba flamelloides TaxID=1746091 RepID=A0AAV7Z2C0_9EUKA|nr:lysophosphatidic acid phosphatase type [Anaeramoeba flamelloides]KAJ6244853.1 lysophosphatidic acid phosphatase type 6 [Anaeramoeba flamelloides]